MRVPAKARRSTGPAMVSWGQRKRTWRASRQPLPVCTEKSSTAFTSKENMNYENNILSLAIPSSARMKISTAPHTTKSRFFNLCKPQRQEPDCLQDSLELTCRSIAVLESNSLLPESKAASHAANLMSDTKYC